MSVSEFLSDLNDVIVLMCVDGGDCSECGLISVSS